MHGARGGMPAPSPFLVVRGHMLASDPSGRIDLLSPMVYHSEVGGDSPPWPPEEGAVYESIPLLFRMTRTKADHGGCSAVPDLQRIVNL